MATKEARDAARRRYRQFLAGKGWPTSRDVQDTWELSEGESSAAEKEAPKESGAAKARPRSASSASRSSPGNKPSPKKAKKK